MMYAIRARIPLSNAVLLRLAVLGGLMVVLLGIGFVTPRVPPEFVLMAVAAPPAMLIALSRFEYGVLIIVLAAAFVRFSLPTGTQSRIVTSLLVTCIFIALWVIKMLIHDKKLYLKPSRVNVPLLGFILAAAISYPWSNAFRDPLVVVWGTWPIVQMGGLGVMVLLPGALIFTANIISETRWLKWLCWLMICVGLLSLAAYFARIQLSFLNVRGLFSLWFVSLAYAQVLFNKKLAFGLRLALFGVIGAWLYIYFFTQIEWLSGWLPSAIAIGLLSTLRSKKMLLVLVIIVVVYLGLNWAYYTGTVLAEESEVSGQTRMAAWEHNWRVTGQHLLFGTGPAGYAAYYMSYFPSEAMATHNNYIDIISQTGIVGLFFCLWFFGALGWTGYKVVKRLRGAGNFDEAFANAALAGWMGCIVSMALGDWMFPFVYTQTIAGFDYAVYSWVLLGGIVALNSIHRGESDR
jgi:O-antigen ligase